MIYLSAQPDELYFLWQTKLQIFNFKKNSICKEDIHVLIGYNKNRGLNPLVRKYIETNQDANFFIYEDSRKKKEYPSSIRPHIIHKHFKKFPYLENQVIFYLDSDVLIKKTSHWDNLLSDSIWYASNTRYYTGIKRIIEFLGENLFEKMCSIVNIDKEAVIQNDIYAGGAQYILKNVPAKFWKKVEQDSENLYSYLQKEIHQDYPFSDIEKRSSTFIWYTDMWVLWWNAIKEKREFRTAKELDFCWACSHIKHWEKCNILHYTGEINTKQPDEKYFRKNDYIYYEPFEVSFHNIDNETCSSVVTSLIKEYQEDIQSSKISLTDTSFIIPIEHPNKQDINQTQAIVRYLSKKFQTDIHIIELNSKQLLNKELLPPSSKYHFFKENDTSSLSMQKNIDELTKRLSTPYICLYNKNIIMPSKNIIKHIEDLRKTKKPITITRFKIANIDIITSCIFCKIADDNLLVENIGKTKINQIDQEINIYFFQKEDFRKIDIFSQSICTNQNISRDEIGFMLFSKKK